MVHGVAGPAKLPVAPRRPSQFRRRHRKSVQDPSRSPRLIQVISPRRPASGLIGVERGPKLHRRSLPGHTAHHHSAHLRRRHRRSAASKPSDQQDGETRTARSRASTRQGQPEGSAISKATLAVVISALSDAGGGTRTPDTRIMIPPVHLRSGAKASAGAPVGRESDSVRRLLAPCRSRD